MSFFDFFIPAAVSRTAVSSSVSYSSSILLQSHFTGEDEKDSSVNWSGFLRGTLKLLLYCICSNFFSKSIVITKIMIKKIMIAIVSSVKLSVSYVW